jgi:hypothetical protein
MSGLQRNFLSEQFEKVAGFETFFPSAFLL